MNNEELEYYKYLKEQEIKEKDKEIRELKNTINQAKEWVKKNMYYFPNPQELLNILDIEVEIPLDKDGLEALVKLNGRWYKKNYGEGEGEDK